MELIDLDEEILVCIKPAGVLSTDEPGGLPELAREKLKDPKAEIRTVHRLDRVVSGLMVLARSADTASELSRQIRENEFHKEYLAVVHGKTPAKGEFRDLMLRDKARKMSFVTDRPGKGVQEAVLRFETLSSADGLSLVRVELLTGRTHQIRCQFAAHGFPLAGERKYQPIPDEGGLALWSWLLRFRHPKTGEERRFSAKPAAEGWWAPFSKDLANL